MPAVLTAPAAPDPDDVRDYLTENQLRDLGFDPDMIGVLVPHATDLRAFDGTRCWAHIDLTHLLDGEGGVQ